MSLYLIADVASTLSFAWVIFQVVAGLGFVIFVHELGHFLVAKACGVKCEKFYIGFDVGGRKLWHRQWGETEYGIGVVPLGGYVKMLGQDDNPSNMAEENERSKLKQEGEESASAAKPEALDPRSYMAKSVPQRMAIISAGVVMNLIFGFIFAVVAFRCGVKQTPAIVNDVQAGSPAWEADLRPGYVLIQIGNKIVHSFRDLVMGVALFDKEKGLDLVIKEPGSDKKLSFNLQPRMTEGRLVPGVGIVGPGSLKVTKPVEGSFLSNRKVDLQEGDLISAVDGTPLKTFQELIPYLADHRDADVVLTVERGNKPKEEQTESTAGDSSENSPQKLRSVEVTIPARPIRRLGLVMAMGPITAIQKGSPAEKAGLQAGDIILQLNGASVGDPETLPQRTLQLGKANDEIKLTIERSGKKDSKDSKKEQLTKTLPYRAPYSLELSMTAGDSFVLPGLGVAYLSSNKVESVIPDSPAEKAEIKSGDTITSFNFVLDEKVKEPNDEAKRIAKLDPIELDSEHLNWPYIAGAVNRMLNGLEVQLSVKSGKKTREVTLSPYESEEWHMAFRGHLTEQIQITRTADTWGEAVQLGKRELWYSITMVYRFLQKIGHQVSFKALGGPITIAQAAGMSAFQGPGNLLIFLTMLSANLAVINFLPIPVLDGGHMVFLAWEGIFRKPMSEKIVIAFHMIGFAMIISLMLFVIGLDIGRLLGLT